MRTELLRGMPVYETGSNRGRLNRMAAAEMTGFSSAEISKAYNNWIQVFRYPESTLTFLEYIEKLKEAGIRPGDVGNKVYQYHLARYGDVGPYSKETCRFVTAYENLLEQHGWIGSVKPGSLAIVL